jgi:DNA-binding response OmpR family regulator
MLEIEGFVVDVLGVGKKAYDRVLLYRELYNLILLDLGLPDVDGGDLIGRLRSDGISIPVVVLTGRSETESKVAALNAGADDYVVKPFSTQELVARINSVLRRPAVVAPPIQKIGDLSVDSSMHRVEIGGITIALTPKEYSLFESVLRRRGEVVTRDELAGGTWNFDSVGWSNTLDVHMKNLRKKLELHQNAPRIETVRGIGYRLVIEV